jgi:hypothetical protein
MARWKFTDVRTGSSTYSFEVNPNDGGSPAITKTVATNNPIGPGRHAVFSEGRIQVGPQEFSGVILNQTQFETMELWALKRTLLQVEDDLGRKFQGSLSSWSPHRVRKPFNPWYHTYSATLTVTAMTTANGTVRFGYLQPVGP